MNKKNECWIHTNQKVNAKFNISFDSGFLSFDTTLISGLKLSTTRKNEYSNELHCGKHVQFSRYLFQWFFDKQILKKVVKLNVKHE